MRGIAGAVTVFIVLVLSWQAYTLFIQAKAVEKEVVCLKTELETQEKKSAELAALKKGSPSAISLVYQAAASDVMAVAKVMGLRCIITFLSDKKSDDALTAAGPSLWEGVKELRLSVVFSGIRHQSDLAWILAWLRDAPKHQPVMINALVQEKDILRVEMSLFGV